MKQNVLLLTLVTLLLSATTLFADWEYPKDSIVYNGEAFSAHHLKKSYERTIKVIKDAITPEDYGMIAFDLIQETNALLCAMESIACDRCSMYYDRVVSMRHKVLQDLIAIYVINLSYDDVGKKHRLFDLTQLIISAFLKSPCLQEAYPCLARFIRNSEIQIAYCRGMKAYRLEGQDLGIFINTLLDMTENPKQFKMDSDKSIRIDKSHYDCCGRKTESTPATEPTEAAPQSETTPVKIKQVEMPKVQSKFSTPTAEDDSFGDFGSSSSEPFPSGQ